MNGEINFGEVYKEFYPKVLRYISRFVGNEAEDITQEVFEKANSGLESFKGKSKLSTWIYRIATNLALDKLRSPSFKRFSENLTEEIEDISVWTRHKKPSVDRQLIRKQMSECVREHIDKLSLDYKTVIILSELEGFNNKEIADILQISIDNVKMRLHRARASLKKILDEACDFYHNEQNILSCDKKTQIIKFKKSG
ncbi:MAG TPA: sigma-70 family RNA polymerase sigma factor [candidate division Zixibacteria bacterium]|nr:sigma-70 family RNA polymerase sigma factor [candidate division Zixibacteria bacterium]